jgi:hypothetical protein
LLFITEETQKKQLGKDPTVETSFLPDRYVFQFMIFYLGVLIVVSKLCLTCKLFAKNDPSERERQRNKQSEKD